MGKIVVFNRLGMIEIYCQRKNLLVRAIGIILVAVSNDCSVNLNGQVRIMAQAQNVNMYFEPKVLLHKKYVLTRNENHQNKLMGIHQVVQYGLIGYVWYSINFHLRSVLL